MKKVLVAAIISVISGVFISGFLKLVKLSPAMAGGIIGIFMAILFHFLYNY